MSLDIKAQEIYPGKVRTLMMTQQLLQTCEDFKRHPKGFQFTPQNSEHHLTKNTL